MKLLIEFKDPDATFVSRALRNCRSELFLAGKILSCLPRGSGLTLVIGKDAKPDRFEMRLKSGRLAWTAHVKLSPPSDFAGKTIRRFVLRDQAFSYFDPKLAAFLKTLPLN